MKSRMDVVLLLLTSIMLVLSYKEQLIEQENIIYLHFEIDNMHLPLFLQPFHSNSQISAVYAYMGHRWHTTSHLSTLPRNGVNMHLYNNTILHEQPLRTLSTVFSVTHHHKHTVHIPYANLTYLSTPQEKLCGEHITALVNTFLPCHDKSGLASLLNFKSLLTYGYVGITVTWTPKLCNLTLIIEKMPDLKNFIKITVRKCYLFSDTVLQLLDDDSTRPSNFPTKYFMPASYHQQKRNSLIDTSTFDTVQLYTVSRWYHPRKQLVYNAQFSEEQGEGWELAIARVLLPEGFRLTQLVSQQKHYYQLAEHRHDSPASPNPTNSQLITVYFPLATINSTTRIRQLSMTLHYEAHLIGFYKYEVIGGGGEYFMNLPLLVSNGNSWKMVHGYPITDRLRYPDFSIPFHTLTFTVAILGYMWLGIWRSLLSKDTIEQYFPTNYNQYKNDEQLSQRQYQSSNDCLDQVS